MDPQTLLLTFALLACPIGMGLMMWRMNKNMSGQQSHSTPANQTPADRLTALHAQRQTLEAEIAETARIAELESKRDELRKPQASPQESPDAPVTQSGD